MTGDVTALIKAARRRTTAAWHVAQDSRDGYAAAEIVRVSSTADALADALEAMTAERDAYHKAIERHREVTEFGRRILWDNAPLSEVPHIPKDVDLWEAAGLDVTAERAALASRTTVDTEGTT